MSKLLKKTMFVVGVALLPAFALAQEGGVNPSITVSGILGRIHSVMQIIVPIIMTLALLYFLWGLSKYVLGAGNDEAQKEGRSMIIHGIIALFVMAAVWGLVAVLSRSVGVGIGGNPINIVPGVPGSRNVSP